MDEDNLDKNKKLFPQKLWELIHDDRYQSCLRWSEDGQRVYLNRDDFEESYLKKPDQNQFNTQKAISFVRQMNMYGFKKVDDFYYENENFKRDSPDSLKRMIRRHPARNSEFMTHELHNIDYESSTTAFLKAANFQTNNNANLNNNRTRTKDHKETHDTEYILNAINGLRSSNNGHRSSNNGLRSSNHCSPVRSPTSPIPLTTAHSGSYAQPNDLRIGSYDSISSKLIGTDEEIMQRGHWTLPQDKSLLTPEEVRRGQRINGVPCDKCPIIGCNIRVSPTNTYPALVSHLYGYHFSGFTSYKKYQKPNYYHLYSSWNRHNEMDEKETEITADRQNDIGHHDESTDQLSHDGVDFKDACDDNGVNHKDEDDDEEGHDEDAVEDEDENDEEPNDDDDQYQEDSLNSYSPTLSNPNKRCLVQLPSSSSSLPSKLLRHQQQLLRQQQPQDLSNYSHQNQRFKNKSLASPNNNNHNYNESGDDAASQSRAQPQKSLLSSSSQLTTITSKLVKKICDQREVRLEPEASLEAERFTEKLLSTLIDDAAMIVEHQNESKSQSIDKSNRDVLIDASSLTLALKFMPSRLAAALNEKLIT